MIKLTGPKTEYAHPRCYANIDMNCSSKISKEHFISESLLRQINFGETSVKISGLSWQIPQTVKNLPLSGLASNILCTRHNSALHTLDDEVENFSKAIFEFDHDTGLLSKNITLETRYFSGRNIEDWMLKCLVGLVASGNLKNKNMKPECLDILFGRKSWPGGWGLYTAASLGDTVYHSNSLLIESLINPTNKMLTAARFFIRGIPFLLFLGKPNNPKKIGLRRPGKIIFESLKCTKTLKLSWGPTHQGKSLKLTRRGTYEGNPPNWKEWEKNG